MKKQFKAYALLGSGRLARHFNFYLQSLNLPVVTWSRRDPFAEEKLKQVLSEASHVLLAVSDHAIPELADKASPNQTVVHFSGALRIPKAHSAHPLMTFGENLEELSWYRGIPFVVDEGEEFLSLLPGLSNPHYALSPRQRTYYHALCSLAGNSTYLLWRQIGDAFERELGLPRHLLSPFLHQVVSNSGLEGVQNFTGPVARGDWDVVKSHIQALKPQPELLDAYKSYLGLARNSGVRIPEALL